MLNVRMRLIGSTVLFDNGGRFGGTVSRICRIWACPVRVHYHHLWKKRLEEMQTLRSGCSKAEPKISPRHRPHSRGCGMAKIQSAGDGHYLFLQTQFGEDRCTQFRVIVVTDPQTHTPTHKQTNSQTGPITIHCAAASTHCNKWKNGEGKSNEQSANPGRRENGH